MQKIFVSPLPRYDEVLQIRNSIDNIWSGIDNFTASAGDAANKRISFRLTHLSGRIHRRSEDPDEQVEEKNGLQMLALAQEADLIFM